MHQVVWINVYRTRMFAKFIKNIYRLLVFLIKIFEVFAHLTGLKFFRPCVRVPQRERYRNFRGWSSSKFKIDVAHTTNVFTK